MTPRNGEAVVRQLVAQHVNMVYKIVATNGIRKDSHLYDDAVQSGLLRLVEAAQRFDESRLVPFANYAWTAVSSGVKDLLGSQQLVHEPLKKVNGRARAVSSYRLMTHAEKIAAYGCNDAGKPNEPEQIYRGSIAPLGQFDESVGFGGDVHRSVPSELTTQSTEDLVIASLDGDINDSEEVLALLDKLVEGLPDVLRDALVLKLEGYSVEEASVRLQCARSTFQNRVKRAIGVLQQVEPLG